MNSGRVLYALIRVKDPNTQLLKKVWINWVNDLFLIAICSILDLFSITYIFFIKLYLVDRQYPLVISLSSQFIFSTCH